MLLSSRARSAASVAMPDNPRFAKYTHGYFLARHLMWLGLAFAAALLVFQVPVAMWQKLLPARPKESWRNSFKPFSKPLRKLLR